MRRPAWLAVAVLALIATPAAADQVIDLPALTGEVSPPLSQQVTFPDDMSGVVAITARMTYTNWPGLWQCEGEPEPEEAVHVPFVSIVFWEDGPIWSLLAMFEPVLATGIPVTDEHEMVFHGVPPGSFDLLAGLTIAVSAGIVTEQGGCEVLEAPWAFLEDVELVLVGDVVAAEPTSLGQVKALFR